MGAKKDGYTDTIASIAKDIEWGFKAIILALDAGDIEKAQQTFLMLEWKMVQTMQTIQVVKRVLFPRD